MTGDERRAHRKAGPDQRWVCGACGKHTEVGGYRDDFNDSSCFSNSVLCEAEQRPRDDGQLVWWPV